MIKTSCLFEDESLLYELDMELVELTFLHFNLYIQVVTGFIIMEVIGG